MRAALVVTSGCATQKFVRKTVNTSADTLNAKIETNEGEIMGLQHKEFPVHGVQFHPESILTTEGKKLLQNFLRL